MANIARITGTGTVAIDGTLQGVTNGLIAARSGYIISVTAIGTGGPGTITVHNTASGTGAGTLLVLPTAGTLPATVNLGEHGGRFPAGLRVVLSGTTGNLQAIVVYE